MAPALKGTTSMRHAEKLDHIMRQNDLILANQTFITNLIVNMEQNMSAGTDAIRAEIVKLTDARKAEGELLKRLADLIKASIDDPAALAQLASDIKVEADQMVADTFANTPAAAA
jgi:hypothetical protein